jgi:hypothetical protein
MLALRCVALRCNRALGTAIIFLILRILKKNDLAEKIPYVRRSCPPSNEALEEEALSVRAAASDLVHLLNRSEGHVCGL